MSNYEYTTITADSVEQAHDKMANMRLDGWEPVRTGTTPDGKVEITLRRTKTPLGTTHET